jgi:pilus assembly protein TadC
MSVPALALGCLGLALALARRGDQRPEPDRAGTAATRVNRLGSVAPRRAAAAALGLAVVLVVGGASGVGAGVAAFLATEHVVRSLEPAAVRRRKEQRATELPLVLDLLAVCLRAGTPLVTALETVATALPGSFSTDLAVVARLQRLGCGAAAAWSDLVDDPDLGAVARAVSRSAESGARLAAAFERLAADRRSALAAAGEARARRAGVAAMAPLGLCFLPAFVSLGIVPIVLSLAEEVLP